MLRKLFATLRWAANHPLHRHAKVRAVRLFIQSQVGARMIPGQVCAPFPNETSLLVPPWMKGAAHFIWPGMSEFEEMSFVTHFLRPEDLFVDIGANIGAFTVLASGVAGAKALAFEPAPSTFAVLARNILLNNLSDRATARNMALGAKEGKTLFTAGLGTENYVVPNDCDVESVEVTLSKLDTQAAGLEPTVVKIDVEGFEKEVLAGGGATLSKPSVQALVMERAGNASRFGQEESSLHEYVRSLSFIPCSYTPKTRTLGRLGNEATGTIIYLRDPDRAAERVRHAPAYRFAGQNI